MGRQEIQEFLRHMTQLQKYLPPAEDSLSDAKKIIEGDPKVPLAIFLKQKNVSASQNNRFLAAAIWLKLKGQATVRTSDVVKALADAQQQRLGNPADILNQNVRKGFCVKTGDGFYVTPEGEDSLTK